MDTTRCFPRGCVTEMFRRKSDGKLFRGGVPVPLPPKDRTESKQELPEGFELEYDFTNGVSLWVPAGRLLLVPEDGGLPVQIDCETLDDGRFEHA